MTTDPPGWAARDLGATEAGRAIHPDAPPGKAGTYARLERERRFLLAAPPAGASTRRVLIEDRYIPGTRLRLRRMTEVDRPGGGVTYKLTQKIPTVAGTPGLITTLYLSAAEYGALAVIPAVELRKVRSSVPPLGVDVFEGELAGLVLAEAEFESAEDEAAFQPPAEAIAEVTADRRFAGGNLATLGAADLADLLLPFGLGR